MKQVIYLSFLGCLLLNPSVEGAGNKTVAARGKCGEFLSYKGSCYAFFHHPVSWEEAELECQAWKPGAHLASIATQAEEKMLCIYIKWRSSANIAWIGLHGTRSRTQTSWHWSDSTPFFRGSYLWDNKSPSTSLSSSECVGLYSIQNTAASPRWVQHPCGNSYPYVCKFKE